MFDNTTGDSDGVIDWYPYAFKWLPGLVMPDPYSTSGSIQMYTSYGQMWFNLDEVAGTTGTVEPSGLGPPAPPDVVDGDITWEPVGEIPSYVAPFNDGGVTWYTHARGWATATVFGGYDRLYKCFSGGQVWQASAPFPAFPE